MTHIRLGWITMPEVRTNLPEEVHRGLKAEAARRGLSLKILLVNVVQEFLENLRSSHGDKGEQGRAHER